MLNKSLSRVVFATALIFAFSACSDDSSGPSFDGEATTAETEAAADDAAEMMANISYSLNFGEPQIFLAASSAAQRMLARRPEFTGKFPDAIRAHGITVPGLSATATGIQLSAAPGCSIVSSGTDGDPSDPYDGNSNGIPDDWHLKAACVQLDSSDVDNIRTLSTTVEIFAKEDLSSVYGFTTRMSYKIRLADEEGNAQEMEVSSSETLDLRSSSATDDFDLHARQSLTSAGVTEEQQAGEERHVAFDPVGSIAYGSALPDGELTFHGRQWYANTDDVSLSFSIKTTDPLVYDSACFDSSNPPFTDGTIVGNLNGNANSASFEINFTACGAYNVSVDNTSDAVMAAR